MYSDVSEIKIRKYIVRKRLEIPKTARATLIKAAKRPPWKHKVIASL